MYNTLHKKNNNTPDPRKMTATLLSPTEEREQLLPIEHVVPLLVVSLSLSCISAITVSAINILHMRVSKCKVSKMICCARF